MSTTPLTDEELAAMEAICKAATPEPWQAVGAVISDGTRGVESRLANATFCVMARSALPRLIANLRAARADAHSNRVEADAMGEIAREWEEKADASRLLGPARMVLDRCAQLAPGYQAEAEDMAQRIVDLIGHPVTDEPPHALVERDELRAEVERLREALNFYANPEHWESTLVHEAAHDGPNPGASVWESGAAIDGGERARLALNVPV